MRTSLLWEHTITDHFFNGSTEQKLYFWLWVTRWFDEPKCLKCASNFWWSSPEESVFAVAGGFILERACPDSAWYAVCTCATANVRGLDTNSSLHRTPTCAQTQARMSHWVDFRRRNLGARWDYDVIPKQSWRVCWFILSKNLMKKEKGIRKNPLF